MKSKKLGKNTPHFVSMADIVSLTEKEKHEIWNLYKRDVNFPLPVQYVNNGRTPIFSKNEIEEYFKLNKNA